MSRSTLAASVALLLTGLASAQVGSPLPQVPMTKFANTKATSLEDFSGRLLLLEFFAFW